jgi:hypothetical protein
MKTRLRLSKCHRTKYGTVCTKCWRLADGDELLGIRICYKDKEELKLARLNIKGTLIS